jgi:hypothetical protein
VPDLVLDSGKQAEVDEVELVRGMALSERLRTMNRLWAPVASMNVVEIRRL